jgi:hypothetical protein
MKAERPPDRALKVAGAPLVAFPAPPRRKARLPGINPIALASASPGYGWPKTDGFFSVNFILASGCLPQHTRRALDRSGEA